MYWGLGLDIFRKEEEGADSVVRDFPKMGLCPSAKDLIGLQQV